MPTGVDWETDAEGQEDLPHCIKSQQVPPRSPEPFAVPNLQAHDPSQPFPTQARAPCSGPFHQPGRKCMKYSCLGDHKNLLRSPTFVPVQNCFSQEAVGRALLFNPKACSSVSDERHCSLEGGCDTGTCCERLPSPLSTPSGGGGNL